MEKPAHNYQNDSNFIIENLDTNNLLTKNVSRVESSHVDKIKYIFGTNAAFLILCILLFISIIQFEGVVADIGVAITILGIGYWLFLQITSRNKIK
jgi:hypothetical protein